MWVPGVRHREAGVPGDGADAWGRAAGPDPQAEVLLREGGQRSAAHHHQDRGLPPRTGGEQDAWGSCSPGPGVDLWEVEFWAVGII